MKILDSAFVSNEQWTMFNFVWLTNEHKDNKKFGLNCDLESLDQLKLWQFMKWINYEEVTFVRNSTQYFFLKESRMFQELRNDFFWVSLFAVAASVFFSRENMPFVVVAPFRFLRKSSYFLVSVPFRTKYRFISFESWNLSVELLSFQSNPASCGFVKFPSISFG